MYNRKQSNILPRINSKIKIVNNIRDSKNIFSIANTNINQKEIISNIRISKEKKPGTSINTKKPNFNLPEIPIRKLSKTANIKQNGIIVNNDNNNKRMVENIINYRQNTREIFYEKYENIACSLFENDEELKAMYNEVNEISNIPDIKKWIDENLLQREIFWTMLEYYIKKNLDVNKYIKKEIYKILKNKILDNALTKSLKLIQFQYNDYINKMHNL